MIKALIATVASDEPTEVAQARRDQALELQEIQSAPPPSRPPLPPQHTATLPNAVLLSLSYMYLCTFTARVQF